MCLLHMYLCRHSLYLPTDHLVYTFHLLIYEPCQHIVCITYFAYVKEHQIVYILQLLFQLDQLIWIQLVVTTMYKFFYLNTFFKMLTYVRTYVRKVNVMAKVEDLSFDSLIASLVALMVQNYSKLVESKNYKCFN